MIEINVEPVPTYRRSQRSSGFANGLIRVVFFLCALIPTCIIAWRIDLVNIRPQAVVVQQPPAPSSAKPAERTRRIERLSRPIQVRAPVVPAIDRDRLPVETVERQIPTEREPKPSQKIRLDLENKVQREPVTLTGPLRIRLDGYRHSLEPSDGNLTTKVVAKLDGPRPIMLSIDLRDEMLIIEPTVVNDAGKSVPFTTKIP